MGRKKRASQLASIRESKRIGRERRNNKVKSMPKNMSASQLADYIRQLQPMVETANNRIDMIRVSGYHSIALDHLESEGVEHFDLSNIKTQSDLINEITRMRVFINDNGSTVEGAKLETAQMSAHEYKGQFGGQWGKQGFSDMIDKVAARIAFENYRKLEESYSYFITQNGSASYGSENLIIELYDAEIRGKDSYNYGTDLLKTFMETQKEEYKQAKEASDNTATISGRFVEDNLNGRYNF